MKRVLVLLIIITVLFVGDSLYAQAKFNYNEELKDIRKDITTLNLLNGLYLNKQQLQQYLVILKKSKASEDKAQIDFTRYSNAEIMAYRKLRNELITKNSSSEPTAENARKINETVKSLKESYEAQFFQYEQQLKSILSQNQLVIVSNYKPCLIPPKSFSDPSRIGQANDSERLEQILTRLRSIPKDVYLERRDYFFEDHYLDKYEKKIKKLTPQEEEQERKRVYGLLDKARSLSDVDFSIQKKQLATELKPKHGDEGPLKKNELSNLGKVLLNPNMIPVVEQRIGQMK